MADVAVVNGFESSNQQFSAGEHYPSGGGDLPSPSEEQLQFVLNSQSFREGLQNMVAEQLKFDVGSPASPSRLPYGGRVFGPVTPIGDIHGADTLNYTKGEKVVRGKLASCYRLADIYGWSHGLDGYITARLSADNNILIAPHGLMNDEVTASSLFKVTLDGSVVDSGSTTLGVDGSAVALHSVAYSVSQDIRCVVHIASPAVVAVSTMKCGLLPLCHEAMAVGQVAYAEYVGSPFDDENIRCALSTGAKVVILRNFGVLIVGEAIEEVFLTSVNVMTAIDTQLNLVPFGLSNLHLPSEESQQEAYKQSRQLPLGVTSPRHWNYGELEFEAFMRELDNAGYRTGHIYRDSATSQRRGKSSSEADITPKKLSCTSDSRELLNTSVQRKGSRSEWVVTPNVYHREELERPDSRCKVTRWVSETGKVRNSASVKQVDANKFAPQGSNPNELRNKVKEIRKEYFEDTITAGPQSTILEGVTWEEAQRIKQGQEAIRGVDNVFVTAASRGIIQREHQPRALFYKNYAQTNPFDHVTKDDLDAYKHEVERKNKRRIGGYMSADELDEPSVLPDNRPMSAPPPLLSFSVARPVEASRDTTDDEVFKPTTRPGKEAAVPLSPETPAAAGTSKEDSAGRDTPSEGGTLSRKKKRGFRFPSFSKKKEKESA
jgi:adducin